MLTLCACKEFRIESENATFVRDFKPLCHEVTCERVKRRREQIARMMFGQTEGGDDVPCTELRE